VRCPPGWRGTIEKPILDGLGSVDVALEKDNHSVACEISVTSTPARALALLATLQSADIILPTTDGREIRLRRVATPTPEQQRLLDQLDISIPAHLEWNAECSADFVTS
jgi:hypothetical protein